MTQTTHDLLINGQITLETRQNGHAVEGNNGLRIFYLKCFWAWLKIFHFIFSNHLGGSSQWSFQALHYTRLTTLQGKHVATM
jgi:hypothetical protein